MSYFIVSKSKINSTVFGNVNRKSWRLSASDLALADESTVSSWMATGAAPASVRLFNSSGSSLWGFPTFTENGGRNGRKAVKFDGTQRIMTATFSGIPQAEPHTVIAIVKAMNPSVSVGSTARIWGSGATNSPNIVVNANGTVSAVCGSENITIANPQEWTGFGLSWDATTMSFTSPSEANTVELSTEPDDIVRNFVGGNNSALAPNGLRGEIETILFFNRSMSVHEMRQQINSLMAE